LILVKLPAVFAPHCTPDLTADQPTWICFYWRRC